MAEHSAGQSQNPLTEETRTSPSVLMRYGVAVGSVTLALLLVLAFRPLFGPMPASLFFLATIGSAWYGGVRAGLLATLGATIALDYLSVRPAYSLIPGTFGDGILLGLFVVTALTINVLIVARRRAELALRQMNQTLEQRVQDRAAELTQANAALQTELVTHKSIEAALRASEGQYRRIVETTNEGVWTVDAKGFTTFVNPRMAQMLGYSVAEMRERSLFNFVAEEHRSQMEQRWQRWQRDLAADEFDVRLLCKDGRSLWALAQATPVLDAQGTFSGGLGMFTDITTRKHAEEQLRVSEERFRLLVETVQDYAIFLLDPSGRIITWNRGAERIKGYRAEEILGQHFSCFYPPEDQVREKPARQLQIATTEGRSEDEGWRVRKDGTRFWANAVITALRDETGALRGFAKVTRDMTTRKQADEEIWRLNAELEQRVAQRTVQLQQSTEDLQQFTRLAAHDLQEPLRQIMNYVQLLRHRYQGKLDSDAEEFINYAIAGAKRLQQLILDLLAYTEIETRPQVCMTVDGETLLAGALGDLRGSIAQRGATVTHDPLPLIWGDPGLLQLIFRNLLSNGIKFHNTQPPHVHVSVIRQGQEWLFSVRDNGIGIRPEDRERIFMPFQRLHHQEPYPKPGVGLAVCRRIIERHNGKIWVESTLGQGATFFFTLPASQTSSPSSHET